MTNLFPEFKPNAQLAYKVLDAALANRKHLEMGEWVDPAQDALSRDITIDDLTRPECGTTACFAGWTVAISGYGISSGAYAVDLKTRGEIDHVENVAQSLLGMSSSDALHLFYVSEDDLEEAVGAMFGPRPAVAE